MPEKATLRRARRAKRAGKAPSSQAGEFVREEIHHIREGKHGARSTKQAIAIGLSKARRAGIRIPRKGAAAKKRVSRAKGNPSPTRSRAVSRALRREGHSAASHKALARQARSAAAKRSPTQRSASARRAARTRAS